MIYYFTIYGKLLRAETEVKKRHFLVSLTLSWLYIDQNGKMTNSKVSLSRLKQAYIGENCILKINFYL